MNSSRREFLAGALALPMAVGASSRRMAAAATPRAAKTFLVLVNLRGGNDGLNTVVPLQLASYLQRRPTLRIPAAQALPLTGPGANPRYGLHPALARLAARYTSGQVAIVNRAGYPDPNLSHEESMNIWSRGYRELGPGAAPSGWIARFMEQHARGALEVVGLGTGRLLDFQGGEVNATVLQNLQSFGFAEDPKYPAGSRYRNERIRDVVAGAAHGGDLGEVQRALLAAYGQVERMQTVVKNYQSAVVYPQSGLAQRLREAAMLVQADLGTRIFYVQTGGYDTHASQGGATGQHAGLLGGVDAALAAFAQDLEAMGAFSRCAIVVLSEFGRRNDENGGGGTDHGSSSCMFVLGGSVRGGFYGQEHNEGDLQLPHTPFATDFRTVYKEILSRHLGHDPEPVFREKIPGEQPLGLFA